MQPSRHKTRATFVRASRVVAALALVLALLSGIAPAGSLASASECSMSCCIGLPSHAAGECAGVSCHVKLPEQTASSEDTHGIAHDAHGESHDDDRNKVAASHEVASHEVDAASAHQHESQPQLTTAARDASHASHAEEARDAETLQASESSATTSAGHASSKSKQKERRSSVAPASLARPCPSDCGMAAGNAGNNVRPRDAATLTPTQRPRPPARLAVSKHSAAPPVASSGKHRLAPPRAPPLAL